MSEHKKILFEAAKANRLIIIAGAGIGIGLSTAEKKPGGWADLVADGLQYLESKALITNVQYRRRIEDLVSDDIDDLLSSAEFLSSKLKGCNLYAKWLAEKFEKQTPADNDLSRALNKVIKANIQVATTNYDTLIEHSTESDSVSIRETTKLLSWMKKESSSVLHLHGVWSDPESCVLGIVDYSKTLNDELRSLIQRSISALNTVLYVGCGDTFADPNFKSLSIWLRETLGPASPTHYGLVLNGDLDKRRSDPAWIGFVEPIPYARHEDLPAFLNEVAESSGRPAHQVKLQPEQSGGECLSLYRSFLIKDCGQMTIEGVRADMDTAQRKFDIEKLFVPLSVAPAQVDDSKSSDERSKRLAKILGMSEHGELKFCDVFKVCKRIALLALPGGGKTLLLKRLAVAYADVNRRCLSKDNLPDIDLFPIMIRCRDWREYIKLPIQTIIQRMDVITGQQDLSGLWSQVRGKLRDGRVLLLVDGLDEIHDDGDRAAFVDNLEKFIDEYKSIRVVVTSREAGFKLIAPAIARFCDNWKVLPLGDEAIGNLCDHWHALMSGEGEKSASESNELKDRILNNPSLKSLSGNPLLLTMLLVVKSGAGRLPPDRVSLYDRAVEVLLDTWNIRGHEPLSPKEAVPQLAFVAFELMKRGQQTVTESDLLLLIEQAREVVPQAKLYAKGTAYEFLKRVELRSSLLVEAGHQMEGIRAVPFYQFRHLTFQVSS